MKFTIKTKLIITLCVPLLFMAVFFIASLINTESAVLAAEQSNVKSKMSTMLNNNLKGQIDTVTRSISGFYEQSKLENIKKQLAAEMKTFKDTIEQIYKSSASKSEATTSIYAFLNQHHWGDGRYLFAYDADSWTPTAHGSNPALIAAILNLSSNM